MTRTLIVTLLVVTAVMAAPVPKKPGNDYQKLADETKWTFAEARSFQAQVDEALKGYETNLVQEGTGDGVLTISTRKDGEKLAVLFIHRSTTLLHRDGVIFTTEFSSASSGCSVVAFDLTTKKELWKCDLKGLGPIEHSKYRNEVRMEVLDDSTLRVFGKESSGRYVEIVDRHSGKTVGHKVFAEEKK
jgi:hypothetical protein